MTRTGAERRPASAPSVALVPPHNLEAEQALLGGMLLAAAKGDTEAIAATVERIGQDAFYPPRHRLIWGAINPNPAALE